MFLCPVGSDTHGGGNDEVLERHITREAGPVSFPHGVAILMPHVLGTPQIRREVAGIGIGTFPQAMDLSIGHRRLNAIDEVPLRGVFIIDGDDGPTRERAAWRGGYHGEAGEHELTHARIHKAVRHVAQSRLAHAIARVIHFHFGRQVLHREVHIAVVGTATDHGAAVQNPEVRGVQVGFQALQPVVIEHGAFRMHMSRGQGVEFEKRKGRGGLSFAQVHPHHATAFAHRIAFRVHGIKECLKPWIGPFAGRFQKTACGVKAPAVINADEGIAFVSRQGQRGTAVRTGLIEKTHRAVGRAPDHVVLAEQTHALRRAIGFQRRRNGGGHPILAEQAGHAAAGSDASETIFLVTIHHALSINDVEGKVLPVAPRNLQASGCAWSLEWINFAALMKREYQIYAKVIRTVNIPMQ